VFHPLAKSARALEPGSSAKAALSLASPGNPFWEFASGQREEKSAISWYLAGTLPNWQGTPLAVAVALEEDRRGLAQEIGRGVLQKAIQP